MKDIWVYDFEFNLLHIEPKVISSNWSLKYNGIGTFEGHFDIKSKIVEVALKNDYLVIIQGDKQAIVTGKQALSDFVIYGRTVNWILSKRVTPKFLRRTGTRENLSRLIVSEAFADVPSFIAQTTSFGGETVSFWRNVYNPTSKVISECLEGDKLGHFVYFDVKNKNWVYSARKGKELPIIISEANLNAYNLKYIDDCQNYANGGWYEKIEESEGVESVWEYIPSNKTGIYRWEEVLGGASESEAKASLESKKWERKTSLNTKDLVYEVDYNLGDLVKVQTKIGNFKTTQTKMIKGVNIWYEQNNCGVQPIFSS